MSNPMSATASLNCYNFLYYVQLVPGGQKEHIPCDAKKLHPFYFLNNSVKLVSMLIIFGADT